MHPRSLLAVAAYKRYPICYLFLLSRSPPCHLLKCSSVRPFLPSALYLLRSTYLPWTLITLLDRSFTRSELKLPRLPSTNRIHLGGVVSVHLLVVVLSCCTEGRFKFDPAILCRAATPFHSQVVYLVHLQVRLPFITSRTVASWRAQRSPVSWSSHIPIVLVHFILQLQRAHILPDTRRPGFPERGSASNACDVHVRLHSLHPFLVVILSPRSINHVHQISSLLLFRRSFLMSPNSITHCLPSFSQLYMYKAVARIS